MLAAVTRHFRNCSVSLVEKYRYAVGRDACTNKGGGGAINIIHHNGRSMMNY